MEARGDRRLTVSVPGSTAVRYLALLHFPIALRVSVVIPVYNAAHFVGAAVRSALDRPEVVEVILVEDGGPDESLAVCEALVKSDPRVGLFRHPNGENKGAGASRNLGVRMATGDQVAFLDADDHFLPGRFDADRTVFAEHADADGVYNAIGVHFLDEPGKEMFQRKGLGDLTTVRYRVPPEDLFARLCDKKDGFGHFSLDGLTVKRRSLERMDAMFREDLRLHQDSEFILRAAYYLRLFPGSIDAPVSTRGVHADNRFTASERWGKSRMLQYDRLHAWAVKEGVDPKVQDRFKANALAGWMRSHHGTAHWFRVLAKTLATPGLWKYHELRMAGIDMIFGEGSWLGDKLNKLGWRTYGNAQRNREGGPSPT